MRYDIIDTNPDMFGDYHADNDYKVKFQKWLSSLWEKKDQALAKLNCQ